MKVKIFETIETIIEMTDEEFYEDYELSDCEIATEFFQAVEKGTGKVLSEDRQYDSEQIISWETDNG